MFVYPNPALDAALARLAQRPRVLCGNRVGQPLRTWWPKGHPVYGEQDSGASAPFGSPFFDTGLHCAWFALMHALTRPGSPYRTASPHDAARHQKRKSAAALSAVA